MKKLNKYKVHYVKHSYKCKEIEAEDKKDAEYIAKLNCPKGYEVLLVDETAESIVDRIFNK